MKIASQLVQFQEKDSDCLTRTLFPVNIRLLRTNKSYAKIITDAVTHMTNVLYTEFSDYAELKGISGANVGIPFNLIVVKDTPDLVMINPEITANTPDTVTVTSNCGSLCLAEPVTTERCAEITVKYRTVEGVMREKIFAASVYSEFYHSKTATIQHEVDHNAGVLITSK